MKVMIKLNKGQALNNILQGFVDLEIIGFFADSQKFWGHSYDGVSVYSLYEAVQMYERNAVDKFILNGDFPAATIQAKAHELQAFNVRREDILIATQDFSDKTAWDCIYPIDHYGRLPYLEFHVTDHCNMNCKGCVHFSPLVKGEVFPLYTEIEKDLRQLHSLVPYIDMIRIMGGEPFLNKELENYLDLVRQIYPMSAISVVTNGLLLKSISNKLVASFIRNNVSINVSLYPPLLPQMQDIMREITSKGIKISCSEPIQEFAYALDAQEGHALHANRINCTCPNLYKGALYVCPIIAYLRYFNKAFHERLDDQDGRIDIYDPQLTFPRLAGELHKVRKLCDRCLFISREHAELKKWERTDAAVIWDYMRMNLATGKRG